MTIETANGPIIRIGIVEDDRLTRMLLVEMIKRQSGLALAGNWGTGLEALDDMAGAAPDVLLVDIDLPDMSGIELVRHVKAARPETACIMLTASSEPENVFNSLRGGASGYLIKESSPRELVEGIRAVAEQGMILSPQIARFLVHELLDPSSPIQQRTPGPDVLTSREFEILQNLADNRSPKECAIELNLSYETVRTHLKRIYQKLHVKSRKEATERFRQHEEKKISD